MVWDLQCLEDSERKDNLMNKLINYKGVYRTAMAKPGLLNTFHGLFCELSVKFS